MYVVGLAFGTLFLTVIWHSRAVRQNEKDPCVDGNLPISVMNLQCIAAVVTNADPLRYKM
jgi:hypothetical protein